MMPCKTARFLESQNTCWLIMEQVQAEITDLKARRN
jgi:hypothetical protein